MKHHCHRVFYVYKKYHGKEPLVSYYKAYPPINAII